MLNLLKLWVLFKKKPEAPIPKRSKCNFCGKEIMGEETFMTKDGTNLLVKTCPNCVRRAIGLNFKEVKGH